MTVRIYDGDILLDSGDIALSEDCCCDNCDPGCTVEKTVPDCPCVTTAYQTTVETGRSVDVTVSYALTRLGKDSAFTCDTLPAGSGCATPVTGTFTVDCGDTLITAYNSKVECEDSTTGFCVFNCTWLIIQYTQINPNPDDSSECRYRVVVQILTKQTQALCAGGSVCDGGSAVSVYQEARTFTHDQAKLNDWRYVPDADCVDACNEVVQRCGCIPASTAFTQTGSGGVGPGTSTGCSIGSVSVTVTT